MNNEFKDTLKKVVFDVAVRNVMEKALVKFPMLALPVVNPIFVAISTKLTGMLVDELGKETYSLIVDFKTAEDAKIYGDALIELQLAMSKPETERSRWEIEDAKEHLRNSLHDLVSLAD
jgi:hypothetical protein